MIAGIIVSAISRYQKWGGGGRLGVGCNFEPSCSEYMRQSIIANGLLFGIIDGFFRIRRCDNRDSIAITQDHVRRR
ncbi:MAG: hypothetical protein A3G18_07440 [Rhodospirillales bacterium RIFCSPLOWO2_12_FULL_58_28]|nr:MAG: hypothetical protein A3H92_08910 [Rhodospirillales bacterium RIFCSPLOWO2_02_FULL_58_16]OHC77558.1 MAG: hypothetical protein A3G18_07440 [Rhodospirillales bacterium RIFCSPLOWO2_12_FULL_58_28]